MRWINAFRPTLVFVVAAILLPNLVALVAIFMGIGTPIRTAAILGYVVAVFLARCGFPILSVVALSAVTGYDLVNTIALSFALSFLDIASALHVSPAVHYFSSPLYAMLGVSIMATTVATAVTIIRWQRQFKNARLAPVLLLLPVVVGLDLWSNVPPRYLFGAAYASGGSFHSALIESGLARQIDAARVNVLIVLVEGWGRLVDDRAQALIMAPLSAPAVADRYELRLGTTEYFGKTTSAEMRELCSTRKAYTKLLTARGAAIDCLPARLARRGYDTAAFHAFTEKMFDRKGWYPRVGLQRLSFGEQLLPRLGRTCGAVFKGACDIDVAAEVRQALLSSGGPRLVYWLTLNTHIPVVSGEGTPRFGCDTASSAIADTQVCWMAEMWTDILERVAAIALDPALPPTGILIVGDHAPPLWSRRARNLFLPGKVTWASLWPRGDGGASGAP